eukprot:g18917.t1
MPSEAWRKAVQADAKKAVSSYEELVAVAGEKKAEAAVKSTLKSEGHLPQQFLENSVLLPSDPYVSGEKLTTVVQSSMAGTGRTEVVKQQYEREASVVKNAKESKKIVVQPEGLLRVVQEAVPDLTASSFQKGFKRIKESDDVRKSKKLRTVYEVAADPASRREAIKKLDFMTDTSKRDGAKNALVARYEGAADIIDAPRGSYDSLYQFIAVSLDEFKTTSECVREVMKSETCCMSSEEVEQMEKALACLKRRGPSECQKMAVDYAGPADERLDFSWKQNGLVVNFTRTTTKVNKYKAIRAKCVCRQLEAMNINTKFCACYYFPGYDTFRVAAKKIIGKEIWVLARTWADDPEAGMKVMHPVHLFAAMQTAVRGDAHNALITLAQRDDLISRFMSAQTSMTEKCTRDDYELICQRVSNLKVADYGKWLSKAPAAVEKKD